jgi:hypothetical protein
VPRWPREEAMATAGHTLPPPLGGCGRTARRSRRETAPDPLGATRPSSAPSARWARPARMPPLWLPRSSQRLDRLRRPRHSTAPAATSPSLARSRHRSDVPSHPERAHHACWRPSRADTEAGRAQRTEHCPRRASDPTHAQLSWAHAKASANVYHDLRPLLAVMRQAPVLRREASVTSQPGRACARCSFSDRVQGWLSSRWLVVTRRSGWCASERP